MKKIKQYISVLGTSLLTTVTAHAAQLELPKAPQTNAAAGLTGQGVVDIITQFVNLLVGVSTVIAVGVFVYGAILFTVLDKADDGKTKMKNAAWGLLAILAIGLGIRTIADFVARGLTI
ncbi:MAG: hypothetical protein KBC02_00940 [Candidatus Pacebacteria bacterium]|nr:hypothetical protein [Candidatus Paceibacterota bacterium]